MVEPDRLQSWQSVAAAGATKEDRGLVLDELAATVGQDGWAVGEARPLLLVDAGGEPSDAAVVREHGATDCSAAGAGGVDESCSGKQIDPKGGKGRRGV